MPSQELSPIVLRREIARLKIINEELALTLLTRDNTILAREVMLAARESEIARLRTHRLNLIIAVLMLAIMVLIAISTGH